MPIEILLNLSFVFKLDFCATRHLANKVWQMFLESNFAENDVCLFVWSEKTSQDEWHEVCRITSKRLMVENQNWFFELLINSEIIHIEFSGHLHFLFLPEMWRKNIFAVYVYA